MARLLLSEEETARLTKAAGRARENAYAPYSHFRVGAALLASSGRVYVGCNVENVSFGGTICAERAALCAAVAAGERKFTALAVTAGGAPVVPCGICRQMLAEFAGDGGLPVICAQEGGDRVYTLGDLLPDSFASFEKEERHHD